MPHQFRLSMPISTPQIVCSPRSEAWLTLNLSIDYSIEHSNRPCDNTHTRLHLFCPAHHKGTCVPLFRSSQDAIMARLRNSGMLLFVPVALNKQTLDEMVSTPT